MNLLSGSERGANAARRARGRSLQNEGELSGQGSNLDFPVASDTLQMGRRERIRASP